MNKELIEAAIEQGWEIEPTRGQHVRWRCPVCRRCVFAAATPGDHRAARNHIANLRQHGFFWRGRGGVHSA